MGGCRDVWPVNRLHSIRKIAAAANRGGGYRKPAVIKPAAIGKWIRTTE
jgi:hypothetical protein